MELTKTYDGLRFEIVYGAYTGMEKHAIDLVQAAVKRYVPYILALHTAPTGKACPIYVGTKESNPHIASLLADVTLEQDATYVKVWGVGEQQAVIITGGSEASCYYAAVEFADEYLTDLRRRRGWGNPFFVKPFIDPLLPYEHLSHPLVKERGLWTWGHVIFDYRRYLDNMARLKMNKITVWNDFAPINGKEFVDYAHSKGAVTVALTDSASSPLAQGADHLLIARSDMASFVDSYVAPLSVINALIVAVSKKKKTDIAATFAQLEDVWETYDVYAKNGKS